MKLKPYLPWAEFCLLACVIFLLVFFLFLEASAPMALRVAMFVFILLLGLLLVFFINRQFRTFDLGEKLIISGRFWGREEIDLSEITACWLQEGREGKFMFTVFDLVIHHQFGDRITIRESNYNTEAITQFRDKLVELGLEFRGTQKFSWKQSFKKFVTFNWFE